MFAGLALPVLTFFASRRSGPGRIVLTLLRAGSIVGGGHPASSDVMDGAPLWVAGLVVLVFFGAITGPLHASRRAARYALGDGPHGWYEAWDGLLAFGFGALILWFAYTQLPDVRDLIQHLPEAWDNLRDSFRP